MYEEIRRQSITDELTGIFNRRFFMNRLEQEFACGEDVMAAAGGAEPISFGFIGIIRQVAARVKL